MRVRGLVVIGVLTLAACSRSGNLYGDVVVQKGTGEVTRAARITVIAVPSTGAFERAWGGAIAAFQAEIEPARKAQRAAASSVEEARLAWDRALAARNMARLRASGRNRSPRPSVRSQELWRQWRAAEEQLFQAKKRAWEVAEKHGVLAGTLLDEHKAQQVQTDENGHYVFTRLSAGRAYLYARSSLGGQTLTWLQAVQVRKGAQRADLTQPNGGDWPFVP